MRLILAGRSKVGKTTIAERLSKMLGVEIYRVTCPECVKIEDEYERQACFLDCYKSVDWERDAVYDNSPYTLLAYTSVFSTKTRGRKKKQLRKLIGEVKRLVDMVASSSIPTLHATLVGGCPVYDDTIPVNVHESVETVLAMIAVSTGTVIVTNVCGRLDVAADYLYRLALELLGTQ